MMDKKRKADLKEEPFDNMEGLGYCKSAYEESQSMGINEDIELNNEFSDILKVEITTYDEPFQHDFFQREYKCESDLGESAERNTREFIEKKKKEVQKFECPQCTYATYRKHHLKDHLFVHSKVKPYKCSRCDYSCNRKFNLTKHLLTHSTKKLFKCVVCDYSTNNKQSLSRHSLTHSGTKLFKCSLCSFASNQKYPFNQHMLTHANS
ncbi:UNVERIFIED_CONTAM: hypothetical protein RMT77_014985 [Armadillidium vulgare]